MFLVLDILKVANYEILLILISLNFGISRNILCWQPSKVIVSIGILNAFSVFPGLRCLSIILIRLDQRRFNHIVSTKILKSSLNNELCMILEPK